MYSCALMAGFAGLFHGRRVPVHVHVGHCGPPARLNASFRPATIAIDIPPSFQTRYTPSSAPMDLEIST